MFMLQWFHLIEKICIKNIGVLAQFEKWNRNYVFS